eukprot:scaffold78982_cov26-Tisochrysis_lutea.AAC.4
MGPASRKATAWAAMPTTQRNASGAALPSWAGGPCPSAPPQPAAAHQPATLLSGAERAWVAQGSLDAGDAAGGGTERSRGCVTQLGCTSFRSACARVCGEVAERSCGFAQLGSGEGADCCAGAGGFLTVGFAAPAWGCGTWLLTTAAG